MKDFKIYYGLEFNPFEKGQPDIPVETSDYREAMGRLNYLKDVRVPVIILDEAQFLKTDILNDLIMLMNFNFDSSSYVILILTGTPVLNHTINRAVHEALKQRIVIQYETTGMNEKDIETYISIKLKKAGRNEPLVMPEALTALLNACQGSSRKLNNLMTHCLIVGAAANRMIIDNDTIMEAADEIG